MVRKDCGRESLAAIGLAGILTDVQMILMADFEMWFWVKIGGRLSVLLKPTWQLPWATSMAVVLSLPAKTGVTPLVGLMPSCSRPYDG